MKLNFLNTALVAGILFSFTACNNDDDNNNETIIDYSELSENCQSFISTHFPDATVIHVERNNFPDSDGTIYEVRLNNGMEIDFSAECVWTDIDGNHQPIPTAFIPAQILTYVQENYPAPLFIEGIDKEHYGYQVEISNDIDLKFNTEGTFIGIDN